MAVTMNITVFSGWWHGAFW